MMMKIERVSGRAFSYILYVLAAALGFILAFITVHGSSNNQLFGNVGVGSTAHADVPLNPGCADSGALGTGCCGGTGGSGCGSGGTGGSGSGCGGGGTGGGE